MTTSDRISPAEALERLSHIADISLSMLTLAGTDTYGSAHPLLLGMALALQHPEWASALVAAGGGAQPELCQRIVTTLPLEASS